MNIQKNIATCLGISLTCLILVSQAAYAGIAGYAQFVNGSVQIVSVAGPARALQKGDAVNEGDTVVSAKYASAQIKMQDGGFIAVRPDTKLRFDSFKFNGKEDGSERSYFSLFKGGFRAVTGLIGRLNKPNYRITTAAATLGIRGTDHETFVVTEDSPLANTAPTGTYNKVNVGETFMTTDKGTIFVLPNQMGFAGAINQMPELKPINTDIFTVTDKPTKEAKGDKKEGKEVRETTMVDNTAEKETAPAAEASPSMVANIDTNILQPITTENGTNLTGEGTSSGGSGSTGIPSAPYATSKFLINLSAPYYYDDNNWQLVDLADMTYSPAGSSNLSSFTGRDIAGTYSSSYSVIGSATPVTGVATSGTTGIQFGRWTNVTALEKSYTNPLGSGNWNSNTWMYGPLGYLDTGIMALPGVAAAGQMFGTFNYVLDGSTAPRDRQSGQSGTLTSASISVDFTTSLVSANLALTVGGQAWTASASGMSLNGSQFFASGGGGGLIISTGAGTAVACPTCNGNLNGAFTGLNYAGAILSYNLWDRSNTGGDVSGQAALARDPLITITSNGTGAPTGFYVVATDNGNNGGNGNLPLFDTLNNTAGAGVITPGGVLTSYSSGNPTITGLNQFYNWTTVTCTACTSTAATNAATGIYFGAWNAGSYTSTWGNGIGNSSAHWITGPESGPLFLANALVGTKSFSFDGGMVTNSNGALGTVLNTTTLTVDFTRQAVGININLSVPDTATSALHTWNAQTLAGNEAILQSGNGVGGATFRTSSYNGTEPGLLTVTVDGITPGSGNLSGQLTGTGFNGAILSYNLNASLPSPILTLEQVNGVAALVVSSDLTSTTSNIATPHREVMMSVTDPTSIIKVPVLGFYANAPARMVTDAAGNLTQFDMDTINNNGGNDASKTLSSSTSTLVNAGSDPITGISWGRWEGGSVSATNRDTSVTTPRTLAGSLHWIAGPTETAAVTLPLAGTYTYINAGGTAPTDNLGGIGTLNSATLSADFTAQTVNIGVNVTVTGSTLAAAASNVPIIQRTVFYADSTEPITSATHLAVTCTGTCGTSTQGTILGSFTGAEAPGAMMTYGLQNISAASTQVISGVAAFHR
jgi:hypothetical protein